MQFNRPDSLDENFLQAYPLSRYAAEHWTSHAKSGDIDSTPDLQKLTAHFLLHDHVRANWIRIWDVDWPWQGVDLTRAPDSIASPLYYASVAGLGVVIKMLIEGGANVNCQGGSFGNALQAASCPGSEAIVTMLIESGADVNMQGGYHGSALQAASYQGSESIIKMLIESSADVNVQGEHYGSALQAASHQGSEAIVKILIDNGADVNVRGGRCGTALQAASRQGSEAIRAIEMVQMSIYREGNTAVHSRQLRVKDLKPLSRSSSSMAQMSTPREVSTAVRSRQRRIEDLTPSSRCSSIAVRRSVTCQSFLSDSETSSTGWNPRSSELLSPFQANHT